MTPSSKLSYISSAPAGSWEKRSLLNVAREQSLSRLLMAYVIAGLFFMLVPGTLIGAWNLLAISSGQSASTVSPTWIQAHGHAQIFGWIGCFILGIGFYSIPKLRRIGPFRLSDGWICWAMWVASVFLRWMTNIYQWQWRVLLPLSALLELSAFLIFFRAVSGHKPAGEPKKGLESWVLIVIGGTVGLSIALLLNLGESVHLAFMGENPAFPPEFDQRFLAFSTWGVLVPIVWGFSARWMPAFLGLRALRTRMLTVSFLINSAGALVALSGWTSLSTVILLCGAVAVAVALRLFEPPQQPAKVRGVHASFPVFVRLAYVWLISSAALSVWAAGRQSADGIWGASRHALTVGFLATMVFSVGPRVLPAFSGQRILFSTKLMFAALALLNLGCALRVSSEIIAYQGYGNWAWEWLPVSAVLELTAVTVFALNMACTFARRPVVALTQA